MNTRLAASAQDGKKFLVDHELTIADFALGSFFLQTVVNESSPHYDLFLEELEHHEHCIAFVKHFNDANLNYIENMTPSFFWLKFN